MNKQFQKISILALSFGLFAGTAAASGNVAKTPGVEGSDETPYAPPAEDMPQAFEASFEPGRSYECTALARLAVDGANFQTTIENVDDASTVTGKLIGNVTPTIARVGDTTGGRLSVSLPASATGGVYKLMLNSTDMNGTSVTVSCLETSLYGGYNTNASPFNFLEVSNTANEPIVAVVTVRDSAGEVAFEGGATIQPNGRSDFDIHSQVDASSFGSITITHDGPYGALRAFLAEYSSELELRGRTKLNTRERAN